MREILHCDLNNFFASVECLKNPSLKSVPMAVCGDPNIRHGIILAKNEIAKKYGIVTAETVYSAQKKCKDLVLVEGSYQDYEKYSKLVNAIYQKYTDQVEKFGIDESFLDVTKSITLFGSAEKIAYLIKEEIKNTLHLTISVGVSFNKTLAKLGSDLKKPDAVTVIDYKNYKRIIFPLAVNSLMFVGKSTNKTLEKLGIQTIGDLAHADKYKLVKKLGKLGEMIHDYANGIDDSKVKKFDEQYIPKSISKGTTLKQDTNDDRYIKKVVHMLADSIIANLRFQKLKCRVVAITLKDNFFVSYSRQRKVLTTDLYQEITKILDCILEEMYLPDKMIRAITISLNDLVEQKEQEITLFNFNEVKEKDPRDVTNEIMDCMKQKFGKNTVTFGNYIKK